MEFNKRFYLVVSFLSVLCMSMSFSSYASTTYSCPASDSWISNPSMPTEVKKSGSDGTSNFCDFYQFSWQSFLYLTAPSAGDSSLRNYQVVDDYPILEIPPANSCDESAPDHVLLVRSKKSSTDDSPFVLPERTGQAGGGDVIYDQSGNVVFYEVQFSKNLCDLNKVQSSNNFQPGTTELKTAWKVLSEGEDGFFTIEADIDGVSGTQKLGLIGFHIAVATKDHPEFVWATFEHTGNDPDCTNPQTAPANGWSFTSQACATALANGDKTGIDNCKFNKANPATSITGTPTEICRVYPYGTDINDLKAAENIADIKAINSSVHSKLGDNGSMAIFKNYFIVGALWVSDPSKSSVISNQRGSLRLANTVAETTFQHVDLNAGFVSNCFGCHNYSATSTNTGLSPSLSHILDDIAEGQPKQCMDIKAGPIWSNQDAQSKCPTTCSAIGRKWHGQWTTTVPGSMSVCGCCTK